MLLYPSQQLPVPCPPPLADLLFPATAASDVVIPKEQAICSGCYRCHRVKVNVANVQYALRM